MFDSGQSSALKEGREMDPQQMYNETKFRELLLYVAAKYECEIFFSATKLNKVLFYSDFSAYMKLGKSVTGAEYLALEHGPGPKTLVPVRDKMIADGDAALQHRGRQQRIVALREPDLSQFSAAEMAIVDKVIEELRPATAEEVSDMSHTFLGWQAARAESEATGRQVLIPYGTVFVSNAPIDQYTEAGILAQAKQFGWPRLCP